MIRYVLVGVLVLSGAGAMADELSYSYVQASYQEVDIDVGGGSDADGDGYSFGGSVAIADQWYVFAEYASLDFQFGIDLSEVAVGGGWHTGVAENTDFFASLGYVTADAEFATFDADDSGIGASVGLRSMVTDRLELTGSVSHVDLDAAGDGTAINGAAWYTVSGNIAVGLGVSFDDDVTSYGLGVRLYFDK